MFEGVGILAYQGVVQLDISNFSKKSIKQFAVMFLPFPEMATSLAELLSTKQIREKVAMYSRQIEKASTNAKSSASKIIVFFVSDPKSSICSLLNATEKYAACFPLGPTRTPPKPHFQSHEVGS